MAKEFKSINEQIELLKAKGLVIDDEAKAYSFLLNNNYHRVKGYTLTLRNHDRFYDNVTMQNVMDIYSFDYEFRMCLFAVMQEIEVNVKSVMAYCFTKKYGILGYLDKSNFCGDLVKLDYIIDKVNKQISKNNRQDNILENNSVQENIPFWEYIDSFTISDVSRFYSILDAETKLEIANILGLKTNNGADILGKYLYGFTNIRNICAHGGRLYNRKFNTRPVLNKKEKALLLKDSNGNPNNFMLFGFILTIKRIVSSSTWDDFKAKILSLTVKYPFVKMSYYGFSNSWDTAI